MIITDNKIKNLTYEELKSLIISLYPIGIQGFLKYSRSSKSTFYKVSGGKRWNEVLKDCGLDVVMNKPNSYTKDDVLNDIRDFKDRCQRTGMRFSSTSYRKHGKYSQTIIDSNFGGWRNALSAMEDPLHSEKEYIKTFVLKFEEKCTSENIEFNANTFKRGRPGIGYSRIERVFGSWKATLEYCGIYEKYNPDVDIPLKMGRGRIRTGKDNFSCEDFKVKIDSFVIENNPSHISQIYASGFSKHNIEKAFGDMECFHKKYPNIEKFSKSNAEEFLFFKLSELSIPFVREYPGPVVNDKNTRFDYYIPKLNLLIEIHGEQHYSKNRLFHRDTASFHKQVLSDNLKMNWAFSNGYKYICLPYHAVNEDMLNLILNVKF